jgi:hypothetical protein
MLGEQALTLVEIDECSCGRGVRTLREPAQHVEDGVDVRKHVRLGATERRQPELRQALLQRTEVATAQREIVEEIPSARAVRGVEIVECRLVRGGHHLGAQGRELVQGRFEPRRETGPVWFGCGHVRLVGTSSADSTSRSGYGGVTQEAEGYGRLSFNR